MKEYTQSRNEDLKLIDSLSQDEFAEFFITHIRNLWRIDGLYFLGIEKKFGTDAAAQIDAEVWKTMGSIEAKEIKKMLNLNGGLEDIKKALLLTSWSLDQQHKKIEIKDNKLIYTVEKCSTQLTRVKKGLSVFPCKPVREGYLKSFVENFDSSLQLKTICAPPQDRPENVWCRWEISKKD